MNLDERPVLRGANAQILVGYDNPTNPYLYDSLISLPVLSSPLSIRMWYPAIGIGANPSLEVDGGTVSAVVGQWH